MSIRSFRSSSSLLILVSMIAAVDAANADTIVIPAATPVFGLTTAPDGSLLVADAGSGIVEIRKGSGAPVAQLPGVTDVAAIGRGNMLAITSPGFGGDGRLYRVSRGMVREIADLLDFEMRVNPDGGIIESNPFDVAALSGGSTLVADAAANALLIVDPRGNVDWVATLPDALVSTANAKQIFGCPASGDDFCGAPEAIPAQAVATSIAVGPDGAYYMGELKGFPAPKGESRLWRVEPTARHAVCGSSPDCQVVAEGFTSIIDLTFGPDGTLYVVELDEEGWLAMEFGQGTGGSVSACNTATWVCTEVATGFNQLTSATVGGDGTLFILTNALIPGAAEISTLLSAAGTPAAIGATAGAGSSANISFAMASNLSPTDLTNRGWTCFQPLPDRIVCSRPNQGFPTVGNPPPADRPASFTFLVFNSTGRFVGTEVLLRQDLYCGADIADPSGTCTRHAQLCESTGQPYDFVPVIGYYECVHTAGR